jgi:hypothetical protein
VAVQAVRELRDEDDEDEIVEEFEPANPVLGIFLRLHGFHRGLRHVRHRRSLFGLGWEGSADPRLPTTHAGCGASPDQDRLGDGIVV